MVAAIGLFYRRYNKSMPAKSPKKETPISKDSMELLIAEYNYIAATAAQSNEDRARVSSFYLVAVGSLVAALFSTQFLNNVFTPNLINLLFSILFLLLTLLGTTTILQLTRLRVAWFESLIAMDKIKEFIIARDKSLAGAFRWRIQNAPEFYKPNSVSFLQTVEVAILSALTFGTGVFFFQKGIQYNCAPCNWAYSISLGLLAFLLQIWVYKRQLTQEKKRLQKEFTNKHDS